MADLSVGDRCPSSLDTAYFAYQSWCSRIGARPASYHDWLNFERRQQGVSVTALTSLAESRRRSAYIAAQS
jgi:hypothetical protein